MKLSGGLTDTRLIIQASVLGSPEEEEEEEEEREQGMEDVETWEQKERVGVGWAWINRQ